MAAAHFHRAGALLADALEITLLQHPQLPAVQVESRRPRRGTACRRAAAIRPADSVARRAVGMRAEPFGRRARSRTVSRGIAAQGRGSAGGSRRRLLASWMARAMLASRIHRDRHGCAGWRDQLDVPQCRLDRLGSHIAGWSRCVFPPNRHFRVRAAPRGGRPRQAPRQLFVGLAARWLTSRTLDDGADRHPRGRGSASRYIRPRPACRPFNTSPSTLCTAPSRNAALIGQS